MTIVSPRSAEFEPVAKITEANKLAYARKWDCACWFPDYPEASKDNGFGRLAFMQRAAERFNGWVLWMDADAMFMNFDIDLRGFIQTEALLVAAWDRNGFQSGVMFFHSSILFSGVFKAAYARKLFPPTGNFLADSDQAALVSVLTGESYRNGQPVEAFQKQVVVGQADKTINRYREDWKADSFIFHAVGMPIEEKVKELGWRA